MEYEINVYEVGKDNPPIKTINCGTKGLRMVEKVKQGLERNMSADYYAYIDIKQ
tara:strand:- start:674 stop:835 length:162 start_codon:yes stop_codon:yes gene_type:complete